MTKSRYRVTVSARIHAPPQTVWWCLTTPACLTNETGILRLIGTPAAKAKLKLWSEVSPNRAFALRVKVFEPNQRMIWQGGLPFGLFAGRRTFQLRAEGASTILNIEERFSGPLAPAICKSMPDLNPSFQKFAQAIKQQAEADQTERTL